MKKNIRCRREEYIVVLKFKCCGSFKNGSFKIDKFKWKPKTYSIYAFGEEEIIERIISLHRSNSFQFKPVESNVFPIKGNNYFLYSGTKGKWPFCQRNDLFWIKVFRKESIKKSWMDKCKFLFCLKFYWICLWLELFAVAMEVVKKLDDEFGK